MKFSKTLATLAAATVLALGAGQGLAGAASPTVGPGLYTLTDLKTAHVDTGELEPDGHATDPVPPRGNRLRCYNVHHTGPEFSVDCTGPVSFDIWLDCSNGTRYVTDQVTTGNGARGVLVCPLGSKVTRGGGRQTSSE
ncbi:hypothetical protein [Streptomyces sp. NPDC048361]|uniref:hypothetical protein n=1 Tax=Streptomyces sp. NPDC048361 TaxID=3154720 RepID=UPI0034177D27